MNKKSSETMVNLARAYAGECQAGARYQFLAEKVKAEGYCYLEGILKSIAKNEMAHAKVFYDTITNDLKSEIVHINIDAAYPFYKGNIIEELDFSAHNEEVENQRIYPVFAQTARDEGFDIIGKKFEQIAEVENCHRMLLTQISDMMKAGQLYQKNTPIKWKCDHCGFEETAKAAWKVCPLCGYKQGEVEIPLSQ